MKHTRAERQRRAELFRRFVKGNPPKMPAEFTHREYKRIVGYARAAWATAYKTAVNDVMRRLR